MPIIKGLILYKRQTVNLMILADSRVQFMNRTSDTRPGSPASTP